MNDTSTPDQKPTGKVTLDELETRAFTAIGGPGTDNTAAHEQPKPSNAQILAGAVAAGREMFCVVTELESPRRTMDDDALTLWGLAVAPALEKNNIDLTKVIGDFGPEISAIISTAVLAFAVYRAAVVEIKVKESKQPVTAEQSHGETFDAA